MERWTHTILWDAMKAVIRGKLIAEAAHVKRFKLEAYKKDTDNLRESEQEYHNTNDTKTYQQIKILKTKINDFQME